MQFVSKGDEAPDDKGFAPTKQRQSESEHKVFQLSRTHHAQQWPRWNAYLLETNRRPEDEAAAQRRRAGIT